MKISRIAALCLLPVLSMRRTLGYRTSALRHPISP
jgi:hypothetical protein